MPGIEVTLHNPKCCLRRVITLFNVSGNTTISGLNKENATVIGPDAELVLNGTGSMVGRVHIIDAVLIPREATLSTLAGACTAGSSSSSSSSTTTTRLG